MHPSKDEILDCHADFLWSFGHIWFVQTKYGNFLWSDPDYGGNNTFKRINKSFKQYANHVYRDKGSHIIRNYCGDKITIIL